jgi:hypothetical protein
MDILPKDATLLIIDIQRGKMPSARLRSRPSTNVTARIESAVGATSAAAKPWSARAPMSSAADCANPASSKALEKSVNSTRKIRRLPICTLQPV